MKTLKGPSLHLAQFSDETAPFNSLPAIAEWAAQTGFTALQIPAWDRRLFDVATAAESQTYCDDLTGMLAEQGLVVSELTSHMTECGAGRQHGQRAERAAPKHHRRRRLP